MLSPYVIEIIRTKKRQTLKWPHMRLWKLRQEYFRREQMRSSFLELAFFVLLSAISVWPMLQALRALEALRFFAP